MNNGVIQIKSLTGRRLFIAALFAMTLLVYRPALDATFIWDDGENILHNQTIFREGGLKDIWLKPGATQQYYPLFYTSYWIEYPLWGLNPRWFHFDNLLLHAASAVMLWLVLERLNVPGAPYAAVIFLLHPVSVETVAWVTERKNLLCTILCLWTILMYLRFDPLDNEQRQKWRRYPMVVLLLVAALLSKTIACVVPGVLLMIIWWKRGRIGWDDVRALVPLVALGLAAGLMTSGVETTAVGAVGSDWALSLRDRLTIAGRVPWIYLRDDLWPASLVFFAPQWPIDSSNWGEYLPLAATVAAVAALWLARHRIGRGPVALAVIFLMALFPAMGFFNIYWLRYSYVGNHFQHHAMMTFCVAVAAAIALAVRSRYAQVAIVTTIAIVTACLSFQLSKVFHDSPTLWRDTLAKNPQCWMAAHNLGVDFAQKQRLDEAIAMYEKGLAVKPREMALLNQIGAAYMSKGQRQQALKYFDEALEINPNYAPVLINLATDAQMRQDYSEAEGYARRAITGDPSIPTGYVKLGRALSQQQRHAEALDEFRKAVAIDPYNGLNHLLVAMECVQLGRTAEAIEECNAALRVQADLVEAQRMIDDLTRTAGHVPSL